MSKSDLRILIVDDMSTIRGLIVKTLNELGYSHCYEAEDGHVAWQMVQKADQENWHYDLIFIDINMPNMNGIELLRLIRGHKAYPKKPIIMITTENEKNVILEAIREKASNYILKPFDRNTINQKIKDVLPDSQ